MVRLNRLVVVVLSIVIGILGPVGTMAGEDGEPTPEPGIYVAGDAPQLVCGFDDFKITSRPVEHDDPIRLGPESLQFEVWLSKDARKAGMRPETLVLVLLNPDKPGTLGNVIGTSHTRDQSNKESFRLGSKKNLRPGTYVFGVEKPDFSTGQGEGTTIFTFFGCQFVVEAPPAE